MFARLLFVLNYDIMMARIGSREWGMRAKSILAFCITFIGAFCIGMSLALSELYPAAEEFFELPLWLIIMLIGGICLSLLGLILSFAFKNRTNTFKYALFVEGGVFLLGIVCASFALARTEAPFKAVIVSLAPVLLAVGALCFCSTLIGVCKKGKGKR